MKNYLITRKSDGALHLLAQEQTKKGVVDTEIVGQFEIGNCGTNALNLSHAILEHFYGTDLAAMAEVGRKAAPFLNAFLAHHKMPDAGAMYEISSDVIDRWNTTL